MINRTEQKQLCLGNRRNGGNFANQLVWNGNNIVS